jgi:hypothetical protein
MGHYEIYLLHSKVMDFYIWRKVIRRRREKEIREKNNEFSGHYVCLAARLQRHPGSARASLGQIMKLQCDDCKKILNLKMRLEKQGGVSHMEELSLFFLTASTTI